MNRYFVVSFLPILFFSSLLFSQLNYSVDNIPEELTKNAGSVVRFNQTIFAIKSISNADLEVKYAITILHESHRNNAYFREVYDKFTKISAIKITIYDKNGKKVTTTTKSDIQDLSNFTQSALFADIRQKIYEPEYYEYPFTIEYSFQKTYKGLLNYPTYTALTSYDMSLEKGEFIVKLPAQKTLRYFIQNTDQEPIINYVKDEVHYRWNFENVKPIKYEDYDLWFSDLVPLVKTAPSNFEMDGYFGNSQTWENFGLWINSLNKGRDELPKSTKIEIAELTNPVESNRKKIELVYEYMQSKTRYVNVVIGIGGWQPFTAAEVDENGYGDCKALTNYTYSLLEAVGIQSYYTIIRAGSNTKEIEAGFPSNQFNHAILCVPDGKDTIWLECTSQRNPFGYLGTFTEGREVLLIKESGGQLVKTPSLSINDNIRIRKASVSIDDQGDVKADIGIKYQGLYYDNMRSLYFTEGKKRMDRVRNKIHINNFSLNDTHYSIEEYRSSRPYFAEDYFVFADRYVKKMGNRLLFDINFFNTEVDVPSTINKQESDIYIHRSISKIDSLDFVIPEGYYIKSYPENDTLISRFGTFHTHFKKEGNKLQYTREQRVYKGVYSSDKYVELRSYLKKISIADNRKVLLMPTEN